MRGRKGIFIVLLAVVAGVGAARAETAGQPSVQNLKQLSLEDLTNLEVTSVVGFPQKLQESASAIQLISATDIERSTAETLPEALRLASNLNIAQKNPHDWAISARGFNANVGNKLLVLVDGRSVYTPLFAGVFWNAQDYVLSDVDRIEVISGPGGTLWGANAVNGVINVTTKSAEQTQGLLVHGAAGEELRGLASVRYGGQLAPNVYYRVYAKTLSEDASVLTNGHRAADAWTQSQGGFRIDAHLADADLLTFQGDLYSDELGIQSGDAAHMSGGNLVGRWTRNERDGATTQVQVYFDRTHIAVPFAATQFAPAGFLRDDLDTYDLDVRQSFHLAERHHLTAGIGYRLTHDAVKQQAPNVAYLPAHLDRQLPNVFAQDDVDLGRGVGVILGAKVEHNDYTGYEWEPNVRLHWQPTETQLLWAAVSRAVRMPSRFDRDLYEPAPPKSLIAGGPQFRSEDVVAYESGYRVQLQPGLSGSLSVFYNDYDHVRSWGITPVTVLPITFQNGLEAKTYGFELAADWQVTPAWRLNAGYDALHEQVRLKPGAFDLQHALDETEDPRQQVSLRSMLDLTPHLAFDTAFRWVDRLIVNNGGAPGTVPSYAELDARLAWRLSAAWQVALVGRNLLHAQHAEYGPPTPLRPELQRSVFLTTSWNY